MRIISGIWRGRRIEAPKGDTTRPTTDRVRESLFSSLVSLSDPELGGGCVLDPFAGSGALALEALSRGCCSATLLERDPAAVRVLRANAETLGALDRISILRADALSLAERVPGGPFALILLDPPYTLDAGRVGDLLTSLKRAGRVCDGALVTWEHASTSEVQWPLGYTMLTRKRFGSTGIDIARCEQEAGDR